MWYWGKPNKTKTVLLVCLCNWRLSFRLISWPYSRKQAKNIHMKMLLFGLDLVWFGYAVESVSIFGDYDGIQIGLVSSVDEACNEVAATAGTRQTTIQEVPSTNITGHGGEK